MKAKVRHICRRISIAVIPVVLGGLSSVCLDRALLKLGEPIKLESFLEAEKMMIGVWGTLLGFIITAVSILMAFTGSKLTEEIKRTGHYKTILFCYVYTCFLLLICIAGCIPMVFLESIGRFAVGFFICATVSSMAEVFLCLVFLALLVYSTYK